MALPPSFVYLGGGEDEVPKHIERVAVHNSVRVIQAKAFHNCRALKSVFIPASVSIIEGSAFSGCTSLVRLHIPDSITTIGDGAFYGCSSLSAIELPEGLTTLGSGAFYGCTSLVSAIIPRSMTTIESHVFHGCTMLVTVAIPDSVTSIERNAFYRCSALQSILIPNSVTHIGELAFSECSNAESLALPDSLVKADWGAFSRCSSLESIVIPEGITTIVWGAFADCTSLKSVTIAHSVTSICAYAFHGCTALVDIQIPKSVTDIDQNAFNGCVSLESIVLPDTVTRISPYLFYGCSSLKSIVVSDMVEAIGAYAFQGCVALEQIKIPHAVTTIGRNAFCRCSSLTSITIPFSITSVRELTFSQCSSLTSVIIPESVTLIGQSAFEGCSSLATVTIPESVTTISWGTFAGCISLATVLIPPFVATICNFAFAECESLTSVMIPDSLSSIGDTAFEGCCSLALITIPQHVKTIGDLAFSECTLLEKGSGGIVPDVVAWLRVRFQDHPIHKVCHRADVTTSMIACCVDDYPNSVKSLDSLGMSALHVLLLNDNVDADMVNELLRVYPSGAQDVGPLGRYPLHFACLTPSTPLSVIKLLSGSYTKDGRLALTVQDDNNDVPCTLAIRYNRSDEAVFHLFERYPVGTSSLRTAHEKRRLLRICECYIEKISRETRASVSAFDPLQRHGWVWFLISAGADTDLASMCLRLVAETPIEIVRILAYFKDLNGQLAIESATNEIKIAIETKLLNLAPLGQLRRDPLVVSPFKGVMTKYVGITEENGKNGMSDSMNGSIIEHGRRIGEQRFRKLLKRLNINLNCANELDRTISQETCVELCKDVLDNVHPRHLAVTFMKKTEQFRHRMDRSCNIKLDSGYQFGPNYHFRHFVGRIVSDALKSFRVDEGINKDLNTMPLPLEVGNVESALAVQRASPIRLREFARQLTEAISVAPPHNEMALNVDKAVKSLEEVSGQRPLVAVEAEPEPETGFQFTTKGLPLDSFSRLSRTDRRRFDNLVHAIGDEDSDESVNTGSTDASQATFFAVKTYLNEVVINQEESGGGQDEKRAPATTNLAYRIIRRFCPSVPKNCIPQGLVKKVETYVLKTKRSGDVEHVLTKKSVGKDDLLDFLAFLKDIHDPNAASGPRRRGNRRSPGKAFWSSATKKIIKMKYVTSKMTKNVMNGEVMKPSRRSTVFRSTLSRAREFGPLLNPPSFLVHFLLPSQIGCMQLFFLVTLGLQRRWNDVRHPFTKPLFQLPSFHRQLWKEHFQLSSSPPPVWHPPRSPFLCPLFQLSSFQLRSWDDLFFEASSQHQQSFHPLLGSLGFRP